MFNNRLAGEELIIKSDKVINKGMDNIISYSNAGNQAAYLVKAIRENWQFPEEYLRGKIEYIKMEMKEEEDKKRQEEIKRMGQICNLLDPLQQEEIIKETEKRLPDFWKEKLNKLKAKGKSSKLLEVVLEEKRREIIKEWIRNYKINF